MLAYLPLAGAAEAGIPALSMCSKLNWADLFAHFFDHEAWAGPIHAQILAAYLSAKRFVRLIASHADDFVRQRLRRGAGCGLGPGSAKRLA